MNPTYHFQEFDFEMPLSYSTIYYVESHDNESLNTAMRQVAEKNPPFNYTKLQPFPFRLKYVTQEEVRPERLREGLGINQEEEEANEIIANLRQCLSAEEGGTLSARFLPQFISEGKFLEDYAFGYYSDLNATTLEAATRIVKEFSITIAQANFHRLTNISYDRYETARIQPRKNLYNSLPQMIGFMQIQDDAEKIKKTLIRNIAYIEKNCEHISINDINDLISILNDEITRRTTLPHPHRIVVINNNIYIEMPKGKNERISFSRGNPAKVLYIFYLRLIERAHIEERTLTNGISKFELEEYANELLQIYQKFNYKIRTSKDIEFWWDKSNNEFMDSTSSIRTFFRKKFDVKTIENKYNKCYSIEIAKGDTDKGKNSRYAIRLEASDFDLGEFSVKRL